MEKFTVNGKAYFVKDLDFEYLVELDKHDIKVTNITGMAAVNCFFAYCSGMDEKQASDEISKHIINGGTLEDIVGAYAKALEDSGFFRALMEQTKKEQEKVESSAPKATKKNSKAVTE